MLIDTHCHLTSAEYAGRTGEILSRAKEAGVERAILVAVNPADATAALTLLREHESLFLVLGVHPHEAARWGRRDLDDLGSLARGSGPAAGLEKRIVGIGETGLDFHYDFAPRGQQEAMFLDHLELAGSLNRPVVVHARESELRVCEILAGFAQLAGRVVFHCFSGGVEIARRALDLGCWLSFTGVITFRNADDIRSAAAYAPRERIMLETDAPYLSPEPMRKVRPNEPAMLVHTARRLADIRQETLAEVARSTTANANRFFGLPEV